MIIFRSLGASDRHRNGSHGCLCKWFASGIFHLFLINLSEKQIDSYFFLGPALIAQKGCMSHKRLASHSLISTIYMVWHVALMGEKRNVRWGSQKERNHYEDQVVSGWIILKCILEIGLICTGLIWLKTGTSGGLLSICTTGNFLRRAQLHGVSYIWLHGVGWHYSVRNFGLGIHFGNGHEYYVITKLTRALGRWDLREGREWQELKSALSYRRCWT
jgi:hypothetical protein